MINTTGTPIMPGGVNPNTGMINTTGQPWMPGTTMNTPGMINASGQPLMSGSQRYARRGYGWALPPPPTSAPGRIIISLVPNLANPQESTWIPQLDGNMDFVLTGNDTWINAAALTSLLTELRQFASQLGPNPLIQAAAGGKRFFLMMVFGMLAWFILSSVLMSSSGFDGFLTQRNEIIIFAGFILLVVCGFSRMGRRQREMRANLQGTVDACANFARTWSSKPENSMYELTYRMGLTEPTYFELSRAASGTTAPQGVPADPTQAMYPSAPPQPV